MNAVVTKDGNGTLKIWGINDNIEYVNNTWVNKDTSNTGESFNNDEQELVNIVGPEYMFPYLSVMKEDYNYLENGSKVEIEINLYD